MKESILVTGGLGNLGSWISEYFHLHGFEVFVTTRKKSSFPHPYSEIVCDLTDKKSLDQFKQYSFDYIIHLASYNEYFEENYFEKALKVNTEGTYNLIHSINTTKLKGLLYFSTIHVYGNLVGEISEDSSTNPSNDYASTHLFAEYIIKQYASKYSIPFSILRLSNSYGHPKLPNNSKWYLVLNDFCKQIVENEKIVVHSPSALRDFVWMGDVCKVCFNFVKYSVFDSEIYNLASSNNIQIVDLAKKIASMYQLKINSNISESIVLSNTDIKQQIPYTILNNKIKEKFSIEFSNKFDTEIELVFQLLKNKFYDKKV